MSSSLLQTKLYIPLVRSDLVPRPRLIERLNEGLQHKLTLISAPAGFGKTTLVCAWLRQIDLPVAWLSLDESDSELPRFLNYTIAALQKIDSGLGQTILSLLQLSERPATKHLITLLINDIAALTDKIVLIFDDYQVIQNLDVHKALAFLLERLPPQLHLVILSRTDPPFPLSRLRVRQQITEIRDSDLRFTEAEATMFLNELMNLQLLPEDVTALEARTEGWIAGLQLAALSLKGRQDKHEFVRNFTGSHRQVIDYLSEDVLQLQDEAVQRFLLQTSILDRLSGPLCDAVTGQTNSQMMLETLEQANLFIIPLDDERRWYRYHHLFADFLRIQFQHRQADQVSNLHRRASRWYQEQDFTNDAIHHALAGEDYNYAADRIEQVGLKMVGQARLNRLQQWIVSLPKTFTSERSYLSVLLAWISVLNRQPEQAESYLMVAEPAVQSLAENSNLKLEIACQIAMLRGYISRLRYDLLASTAHIQQAIQLLPDDNEFLQCTANLNLGGNYWNLGNFAAVETPLQKAVTFLNFPDTTYPALAAAGYLTNAYLQRGQLSEATKLCQRVEQELAPRRRSLPAMAYVAIEQGALFYEQNDLTAAIDCLSLAIQLGENLDRIVNVGRAFFLLAWINQVTGQTDEVATLVERANANPPPSVTEFEYYKVRLWLMQGKLAEATQWAHSYQEQRALDKPWGVLSELTFAHILLADKKIEAALKVLTRCEASAQAAGIMSWLIRSLALKALGYQAVNDVNQALTSLQQALSQAEPEGYLRTFIDYGPPMQQLLQQAAAQRISPAYVSKLLAAFPDFGFKSRIQNLKPEMVEPLNERELSILRLMAAGLSNREIADELYLSVNTVKWYSSNIYGKLGVKKRVEAVDRVHELGIL
jgi:LuxR family maltose regulon positive regulatory protein